MKPTLYPIIDTGVCARLGRDPLELARAVLRAGVGMIQLRCKDEGDAQVLALSDVLAGEARAHGARFILNDRADLARMAGADGVHVGQTDLPVEDVRRIVGDEAIVGLSTHDEAQVDAALKEPATYVAVGPIFATGTKDTGYTPRGLDLVRYAAGRGKPVAAIGGITLEHAADLVQAGARYLAVIGDLATAPDPEARARAYLAAIHA